MGRINSAYNTGIVQVWQDGVAIIDAIGRNLPMPDTILNSVELGISSNLGSSTAVLFVDDVAVSNMPMAR